MGASLDLRAWKLASRLREVQGLGVTALLLPDSRTREIKTIFRGGVPHERLYCANCHHEGPLVVSDSSYRSFAFYLCNGCADKHGKIDGYYMVPDEVFAEQMKQEQIEKYGRILTPNELDDVLNDPHSTLAKLAKDRPV